MWLIKPDTPFVKAKLNKPRIWRSKIKLTRYWRGQNQNKKSKNINWNKKNKKKTI